MLYVFRFEMTLLEKYGIQDTYLGHPLAEDIKPETDMNITQNSLCLSSFQRLY